MLPFNRPFMTGQEFAHISQAYAEGQLAGDGAFTKRCHEFLEQRFAVRSAFAVRAGRAGHARVAFMARTGEPYARLRYLPLRIGVDGDPMMGCFIEGIEAVCRSA